VHWLTTTVLQQQLDLDLFRSSALAVEDWNHEELKKLQKLGKQLLIIGSQKKKLEEQLKQLAKERSAIQAEKEELTKGKASLEKEAQLLKQYKVKCARLQKDIESLKGDKENTQKQIKQLMTEKEKFTKFVEPKRLADVETQRDELKRKVAESQEEKVKMKSRIRELEHKLATAAGQQTPSSNSEANAEKEQLWRIREKKLRKIRESEQTEEQKNNAASSESTSHFQRTPMKDEEIGAVTNRQLQKELSAKDTELANIKAELEKMNKVFDDVVDKSKHKVIIPPYNRNLQYKSQCNI
jgi:hypothetical protein